MKLYCGPAAYISETLMYAADEVLILHYYVVYFDCTCS